MIISFLLHLYQPPQQSAYVFTDIAQTCYLPLVKLIKQKKEFKVTLNAPLSLLEWFEKEKIETFYTDVKQLASQGKIELVGSASYHPILTKIPENEIERQILLNECGLSYYLGRTSGFEGEPLLMMKDLKGFFAPEMAFNKKVGDVVNSLEYEWVMLDEVHAKAEKNHVNKLAGTNLGIAVRNRDLSLCLSVQRDSDPENFMKGLRYLASDGHGFVFVCLDGETFGHHNKEGIDLLENLIDACTSEGHTFETISPVVENYKTKKGEDVTEASWGAGDTEMAEGDPFPKWYQKNNVIHESFESLEKIMMEVVSKAEGKPSDQIKGEDLANLPVWNFNKVALAPELTAENKNWMKARVMLDKCLNSDKYWWSSKKPEYEPQFLKRSLELFMRITEKLGKVSEEDLKLIKTYRDSILSALKA